MIAALSAIGFLILLIIYFIVRIQSIEKELKKFKHQSKTANTQTRNALMTLNGLALEMQKSLLGKLEAAKKRKLVDGDNYEAIKAIFISIEQVVMQCCEHGSTVSEAINKSLTNSDTKLEDITLFISNQPNEVKLPWSRNNISNFITACNNIATFLDNPPSSKTEASEKNQNPPAK